MNNFIETKNYYNTIDTLLLNKWEFFLYLALAFIAGYLVHYIFSHRRDYVRAPRKKAFYYNNNLSGGYYPNSEPILPQRIIQTHVVTPSTPIVHTHDNNFTTPKQEIKKVIVKSTKDDLKKIEGIGPKIEKILNNAGIYTWDELSKTKKTKLKSILEQAGKQFQMHDPSTWSEQAHLAATGQWKELQKYQNFLIGGKHV